MGQVLHWGSIARSGACGSRDLCRQWIGRGWGFSEGDRGGFVKKVLGWWIWEEDMETFPAFYIGETSRSLSDRMNGYRFTTTVSNPDLPVAIHTQSHQIPLQECWSVNVIHKLPDSTPDHIHHQFETAYQLILQSRHTPDSTYIIPPDSTLAPEALKSFDSVSSIVLLRKVTVIWPKVYIFISFLMYMS